MDRKGAFEVIRQAIEAAPDNPRDPESARFKSLAVAALVIAEESLNDFTTLAQAVKELASRPVTFNVTVGNEVTGRLTVSRMPLFDKDG